MKIEPCPNRWALAAFQFALASMLACANAPAQTAQTRPARPTFAHPGITQSRADLDFMKAKIQASEQPWKGAWERLQAASYSSLDFQPKPFAHVIRGAYGNPKVGADEIAASANAAHSHALQWYVTGNQAHARKAIEILEAWAPVLEDFQLNDAKLLAGWTGYSFCNAAEILRATDSGWQATEIARFKQMLLGVYYPLLKDFFPEANGNWDATIMSTLLAMGIFCEDRAMFDRAVNHFIRGPVNGGITHYVYPSGQCQESTRDHAHTQLGLDWMAKTARIAWTQGVDLFSVADNRLALGFEYTAKHLAGEAVTAENLISPRRRFDDIYLAAYQHYHYEKGLEMPYTALAVERTLERSSINLLTMYRGPSSPPPTTKEPPQAGLIAAEGGALGEATAKAPADAVVVAPGQSIQAALDSRRGKGGWVALGKGLHTLSNALRIPSGVTLAGQGTATVLWLEAKGRGPAILNAEEDLHEVTLRDFVLEGAAASSLPSDPNSARRTRTRPTAPRRAGIQFIAGGDKTLANIRLENITVRHCTETGLVIQNARQVVLGGCSFTDNGNGVQADPKSRHNVSLTGVEGGRITDCRLNNSPSGCGIDLAACRDITVSANEMARNALQGLHGGDTQDLHCLRNLFEGNEAGGIRLDTMGGACRHIEVINNLVRNNGGRGLEVLHAFECMIQGNRMFDNAEAE